MDNDFPFYRLKTYKGFFEESFKTVEEEKDFKIFMIDCDLYSSTKQALDFLVDYFEEQCNVGHSF